MRRDQAAQRIVEHHGQAADVLWICVSYGGHGDVLRLLETTEQLRRDPTVTAVVVDNNEGTTSVTSLRRKVAQGASVRTYGDGINRGYLGGAAFAFEMERRRMPLPTWVIISNCDVTIPSTSFFSDLRDLDQPCRSQRIGMVAPRIVSERTGRDQNPHYRTRPPAWKYRALAALFRSYSLALAYRGLAHAKSLIVPRKKVALDDSSVREVYAGHGSFMILHRGFFEAGGSLSYECFLYCEEVHLGEQIRERGLKVVYWPQLEVRHAEHATVRMWPDRAIIQHLATAHGYVYRRYLRKPSSKGPSSSMSRISP